MSETPFKRLILRAVLRDVYPMVIRLVAVPDYLRRSAHFKGHTLSPSAEQETWPRGKRADTCRPSLISGPNYRRAKYFAAQCPIFAFIPAQPHIGGPFSGEFAASGCRSKQEIDSFEAAFFLAVSPCLSVPPFVHVFSCRHDYRPQTD
jgi:hypothetical protein